MTATKPVRVRFAPSPTGELHLGGARTALYNFLFARKSGGTMILRVEDTDQKRFVPGSMDRFIDDLRWLGIDYDEGPDRIPEPTEGMAQISFIQSENAGMHRILAGELVDVDRAYYCFCTPERLEEVRKAQLARKEQPRYDRHCRSIDPGEAERRASTEPYVIRLKVPESGTLVVHDLVRGEVTFDLTTIDDQVLLKSDGFPTYHLAAVIDDYEMRISHVLRSEEWLPSAPKYVLVAQALGHELPQFAHLPVILAQDGKKLSKRIHGEAVWMSTYRKAGYLPEALTNYLALLGWNPGGDREFMNRDELIEAFSLDRVHKAGAKFDQAKLDAFQAHYVQQLSIDELAERLKPFAEGIDDELLRKLATVSQSRLGKLADFPAGVGYFLELPAYDSALLVFTKSSPATTKLGLTAARDALAAAGEETWQSEELLAQILERVVDSSGLTNGDVFWPVRVALTGQERSPSPAECLWVLGKDESLTRLRQALERIQ